MLRKRPSKPKVHHVKIRHANCFVQSTGDKFVTINTAVYPEVTRGKRNA